MFFNKETLTIVSVPRNPYQNPDSIMTTKTIYIDQKFILSENLNNHV